MALFGAQPEPELQRLVLEFGTGEPVLRWEPADVLMSPEGLVFLLLQVAQALLIGSDGEDNGTTVSAG